MIEEEEKGQGAKRRKAVAIVWAHNVSAEEREQIRVADWRATPIADLALPVRTTNTFEKYGILTVGELMELTRDQFKQLQNLGDITIKRCSRLFLDLKLPNKLNPKPKS